MAPLNGGEGPPPQRGGLGGAEEERARGRGREIKSEIVSSVVFLCLLFLFICLHVVSFPADSANQTLLGLFVFCCILITNLQEAAR